MRRVAAREANQQFSALLDEVEAGQEVLITRHGKPVAKLVPADAERPGRGDLRQRMRSLLAQGLTGVDSRVKVGRDEMHER
ncbi:MAG TPA: type II toxin-antitoxin system prevent-host-death family antitoxin [Alphaproteobacteria bacterium]|nr:type II toxin-antitoxin system prevent-host-death family antitoxin [Alphaproteobacteria bacterium]